MFQNEFNLDQISNDNRILNEKKNSVEVVVWCTDVEIMERLYRIALSSLLSFGTFRHVRINWQIQTLMIFRGMFGFSFWHNFYMEVKFS